MNRAFSVYLDLVRFAAAVLVYMYHSNQRLLVNEILPASNYGHSSVIVFFVLSGFVIAFVTDTKERDWRSYAASRLSRVYSVVIPAIVLTLLLDIVGRSLLPAIYAYPFDQFVVRVVSSLAMLNEVWFVSITSFSNVPFWSICYESWYYLAFGVIAFVPSPWRWLFVGLLALAFGPKVVLLAPIWLSGVWLYRNRRLSKMDLPAAIVLLVVSLLGIVAFHGFGVEPWVTERFKAFLGPGLHAQLTFSKFFISDYLLTLLVVANFCAMRRVAEATQPFWLAIERPIRFAATFTFALYLLHQPLFLFWAAVIRGDPKGHGYWLATTACVFASVLVIGHVTERRRHSMRGWIAARLSALRPGAGSPRSQVL